MFINVIPSGNLESFDYVLFPDQHPANRNYLYEQFSNLSATMGNIGKEFIAESKAIYDKLNDSNIARIAKAAIRSAKGLFHINNIVYYETLEEIQNAQPVMQRYIMAEPTIRNLYQNQLCNGYSDTYSDPYPNDIGINHYDFRRVTSGIIEENKTGYVSNTYYEDSHDGDKELTAMEKIDIIRTWDIIKMFVEQGEDPTDIYGSKLAI